jgi:23S rRNA (pseudouridine1915-N3)-methyltransferase
MLLGMLVTLAHIGSKDRYETLVDEYLKRCTGSMRCETQSFRNEKALFDWVGRLGGRTAAATVLLDEKGKQFISEDFASWMGKRRDEGIQHVVFAIGPADGWSEEARAAQSSAPRLSLGPMTMAHSLARLVMAEQIYRAFTILTGHPYHRG